jgi:hypothetical protein
VRGCFRKKNEEPETAFVVSDGLVEQQFRVLNAFVRMPQQRLRIRTSLQANDGALDARHSGFFLQGDRLFCRLAGGDEVEVLMDAQKVADLLAREYAKPEHAGKGWDNWWWWIKQ